MRRSYTNRKLIRKEIVADKAGVRYIINKRKGAFCGLQPEFPDKSKLKIQTANA